MRGLEPQCFVDELSMEFRRLWERLNISHDDFIRTTEDRHTHVVQSLFQKLFDEGEIYKGIYEDWYCTPCESFFTESEILGGRCPSCARPVERLHEESYFFKLSKYQSLLLEHFEKNPDFLQPSSRASEILNFVRGGLKDRSVSRTRVDWGIPVPFDSSHTIYVWFDALLNYISAIGYGDNLQRFEELWPAEVHLVGKEIFWFHAVFWPSVLAALDMPLPKMVFAHGWWTVEGEKMSKSKGNVVDPHALCDVFGVDAFRFFLFRDVPFGADGDFSIGNLTNRYNADLANDLGNLANRTLNLVEKNFDGRIPEKNASGDIQKMLPQVLSGYQRALSGLSFSEALAELWKVVTRANKYLDEKAPWKSVKSDPDAAAVVVAEVCAILRFLAATLHPFMPAATQRMWEELGEREPLASAGQRLFQSGDWSAPAGTVISRLGPLFPRKEIE